MDREGGVVAPRFRRNSPRARDRPVGEAARTPTGFGRRLERREADEQRAALSRPAPVSYFASYFEGHLVSILSAQSVRRTQARQPR